MAPTAQMRTPVPADGMEPAVSGQEPLRRLSGLALAAGTGEDVAALAPPGSGRLRIRLQGRPLKAFLVLLAVAAGLVLARFTGIGMSAPQAEAAAAGHTVTEPDASQMQDSGSSDASASRTPAAPDGPSEPAAAGGKGTSSGQTGAADSSVVAYISGAVKAPGVYTGPAGMRINDLVNLAGGLAEQADAARINLAAAVADGEHIHVPAIGEQMPAAASTGAPAAAGASSSEEQGGPAGGLVNVNAASAQELQALPGIGPALAGAIVTWREENGGFSAIEDLLEVSGIGDAKFAQLRDKVSVG